MYCGIVKKRRFLLKKNIGVYQRKCRRYDSDCLSFRKFIAPVRYFCPITDHQRQENPMHDSEFKTSIGSLFLK